MCVQKKLLTKGVIFSQKMHHHGKEALGQAQNKGALPCSTSASMCLLGVKLKGGTEREC